MYFEMGNNKLIFLKRKGVSLIENSFDVMMKTIVHALTYNSPKYLEWNFAWGKFEGFFPLKYEILSFEKCFSY